MNLYRAMRSELVKLHHTPFIFIHILVPIAGGLLFTSYFAMYQSVSDYNRFKLVFEIIITFFPLLISIITGLNTLSEDHTSHLQVMLAIPNRKTVFCGKLFVLLGSGVLSFIGMVVLFSGLVTLNGLISYIPVLMLLKMTAVITFGNIIIYIFHLFIGLKWGLGASLFLGVFESLQVILYSNITLSGGWKYIPFAWAIELSHYVSDGELICHTNEFIIMAIFTIIALVAAVFWISQWEGKKNND